MRSISATTFNEKKLIPSQSLYMAGNICFCYIQVFNAYYEARAEYSSTALNSQRTFLFRP